MPPATTPGKRKRVVKSADARRADILRAGREVFATVGFSEATIADITAAAGMGKGSFYLHFETKDHVLAALWEEYVAAFVDTTRRILAKEQEWWPTIDELLTALIAHAVGHAELHRLVYGSANGTALELCKESNARVVALIGEFVTRGAAAGVFASRNPDWTFRMIYHAADGLLDDLIGRRAPIDTAEVTRVVLELAHRALGHPAHVASHSE
ncbi:TetR/AcrR family transcriptional regulator [Microbispora sp. RL4-1S]|uniref:TetR/AcrR family transcriptional regulator n=1 Tax=Microbispora oryzae TaxID=2806554 RepID=A0A941ARX3_9ACTN|nr:TetR/AcrR family transcriptional regulator [Microbispora oryzae]MBP2706814.1 TetR/AcrR family transcriptional regulator [Microbispora oryzae]